MEYAYSLLYIDSNFCPNGFQKKHNYDILYFAWISSSGFKIFLFLSFLLYQIGLVFGLQ